MSRAEGVLLVVGMIAPYVVVLGGMAIHMNREHKKRVEEMNRRRPRP